MGLIKPASRYLINWASPLAHNLVSAPVLNEGSGLPFDTALGGSFVTGVVVSGTPPGNPTWVGGPQGWAWNFNGSQGVTYPQGNNKIGQLLNQQKRISMCAWFKGTASQSLLRIQVDTGSYVILVHGSGPNNFLFAGFGGLAYGNLDDNVWHFVAASYDAIAGVVNLYVDGLLVNTAVCSSQAFTAPGFFLPSMGMYPNTSGGSEFTNGAVMAPYIWADRALTRDDVNSLYQDSYVIFRPSRSSVGWMRAATQIYRPGVGYRAKP